MYLPDRLPPFGRAYAVFDGVEDEAPETALDEVDCELRLHLRPEAVRRNADLLHAAADPDAELLTMRGANDPRSRH